jgi:osmotically-inducible protein OsmY
MQKAVADRLRQSPYTDVRKVACVVGDGVFTLRGQVTSFFHKQVALSTARQVIAFEEIRNELEVVQGKD